MILFLYRNSGKRKETNRLCSFVMDAGSFVEPCKIFASCVCVVWLFNIRFCTSAHRSTTGLISVILPTRVSPININPSCDWLALQLVPYKMSSTLWNKTTVCVLCPTRIPSSWDTHPFLFFWLSVNLKDHGRDRNILSFGSCFTCSTTVITWNLHRPWSFRLLACNSLFCTCMEINQEKHSGQLRKQEKG